MTGKLPVNFSIFPYEVEFIRYFCLHKKRMIKLVIFNRYFIELHYCNN